MIMVIYRKSTTTADSCIVLTLDLWDAFADGFVFLWLLKLFKLSFDQSALLSLFKKCSQFHAGVAHAIVDQDVTRHEKDQWYVCLYINEKLDEDAKVIRASAIPSDEPEAADIDEDWSEDE